MRKKSTSTPNKAKPEKTQKKKLDDDMEDDDLPDLGSNDSDPDIYKIPNVRIKKQYANASMIAKAIKDIPVEYYGLPRVDVMVGLGMQPELQQIANIVTLRNDTNVKMTSPIGDYEMMILDTIFSIAASKKFNNQRGDTIFTPRMVVSAMSGNDDRWINPSMEQMVTATIDKMSLIRIGINFAPEKQYYQDGKELSDEERRKYYVEDQLLPVKKVCAMYESNGKIIGTAYLMHSTSPLYDYSRSTGKLISFPSKYLIITDKGNTTVRDRLLRHYVIKRVMEMRKWKLDNRIIAYQYNKYDVIDSVYTYGLCEVINFDKDKEDTKRWNSVKRTVDRAVISALETLKDAGEVAGYRKYRKNDSTNPCDPLIGFKVVFPGEKDLPGPLNARLRKNLK